MTIMHTLESINELPDIPEYEHTWWKICSPQEAPGEMVIFNGLPGEIGLDDWLEEEEDM